MLLVFTISVTPKIHFHDALAQHQDELFDSCADEQLTSQHFNCGFINVVAVTPFISTAFSGVWHSVKVLPAFNDAFPTFYNPVAALHHTLRGPPFA